MTQTPEQAALAAAIEAKHSHGEHWRAQRAVIQAWRMLGMPLRDAIREDRQADVKRMLAADSLIGMRYSTWAHARARAGESTATLQTQRVNLHKRRRCAEAQIPPYDRSLPDAQLRERYPLPAEEIRDVAWRLKMLRNGKPQGLVHWQETDAPKKLRVWIKRIEERIADARIAGTSAAAAETELQRVQDKLKLIELEAYDIALRAWHAEGAHLRARPRPHRDRKLTRGGRRGRPPRHELAEPQTRDAAPKRPHWMIEEDARQREIDRDDKRIAKLVRTLKPLQAADPKEVCESIRAKRLSATHEERKRAALESRVHELLDWVWGECRLMHVGEEIATEQGTWLYVDDEHGIPRATTTTRAAALAACAVRLSTGWAFPPETARGRA
jgi:hypothetical protein